jgi:very-short-patch-repair endonuclease
MYYDEPKEYVTEMPEPFVVGLIRTLETAGAALEVAGATESPIESMFGGALTAALRRRYADGFFGIYHPAEPEEFKPGSVLLVAQYQLLRFRYDFALRLQGTEKPFLLIECDGKRWHNTPEQIANDRRKDQCAADHGLTLMRFTGPEIHYRIDDCVAKVVQFIKETE